MTVLSVKNIGKAYRVYSSEWKRFARWFGMSLSSENESWVLRNCSFEVMEGVALGIIGQNGAGKSTLLKIITGTLRQTEGQSFVNGRIAAILELGMGFNPDLSGRENVKHAARIMGFNSHQIENAMPEIESFAEIGEYFDKPVRTYSSGMQVRVAFSVATAWRPEILIVDEALSVGDAYFQHKSFAKIREFKQQGTTLLIVSHDRGAIQTLCDRALLLDKGSIIKDGKPEEVFDYYNALISEKEVATIEVNKSDDGFVKTSSGTGEATVKSIFLLDSANKPSKQIDVGEVVTIQIEIEVLKDIETLVLGYSIKDRLGNIQFGTNTWFTNQVIPNCESGEIYMVNISFSANLGVGSYSIQTALVDGDTHLTSNYEWRDYAYLFEVINSTKTQFVGCNWIEPMISLENVKK
jgi:lipopolysaccharide transport system ATP-binding protein